MTVCPGGMQTNFQSSGGVKKNANESLMSPKKVAIEILNGLQKNKRVLVVSIRSRAMLIASKFLPRRLLNKLWGFLMEKLR